MIYPREVNHVEAEFGEGHTLHHVDQYAWLSPLGDVLTVGPISKDGTQRLYIVFPLGQDCQTAASCADVEHQTNFGCEGNESLAEIQLGQGVQIVLRSV